MTPPTLKQLIEKATPGPWKLAKFSEYHGSQMVLGGPSEHYVTAVQIYQTPRYMGLSDEAARTANAQLIARCSPSVMLAVAEALTLADLNYARTNHSQPDLMGDDEFDAWKAVKTALNALNGKAP